MGVLKVFVVGIALRLAIFAKPGLVDALGKRFELSTALTRYSEVRQEVFWPSAEGSHRPPLVGFLIRADVTNAAFFILLDCCAAIVLYHSAARHCQDEKARREEEARLLNEWDARGRPRLFSSEDRTTVLEGERDDEYWAATANDSEMNDLSSESLPATIAALYLLNPFTILTCGARSFAPLTFVCATTSVLFAQRQNFILAGSSLAWTCYLEGPSYLAILGLPVLWRMPESKLGSILSFASFVSTLGVFMFASFISTGNSWQFVEPTYLWVFSLPDLRPNVGLWWYFMAETFQRFRPYFLLLLHSFIYACAIPLAVYLDERPVVNAHYGLAILHLFQPYPELFHIATTLVLLTMHPQFMSSVPLLAPMLLVVCFSLVLQPIMLHTWLVLGSGNANYYYFQGLIVNGMSCIILIQFFVCVTTRDLVLRRIRTWLKQSAEGKSISGQSESNAASNS